MNPDTSNYPVPFIPPMKPIPEPLSIRILCRWHTIPLLTLARESHVEALLVFDAFVGNPCSQDTICRLLTAINTLTGKKYTMGDIFVQLEVV